MRVPQAALAGQHTRDWSYALVLLIIAFVGLIRIRLRDMPLERDEGEYAYAGQLILQGVPPYQLAYNMKLPGTYAAYAGILAIFGQTPAAVHDGTLLVNAATTFLIFLLTLRLVRTTCRSGLSRHLCPAIDQSVGAGLRRPGHPLCRSARSGRSAYISARY